MNHLILCREYPPFAYPSGGIGTYVNHISALLAGRGDTVHVIAQMWPGAPRPIEHRQDGRLIIHRVPLDEPLPDADRGDAATLRALQRSSIPVQGFAWQAARLAESLMDRASIDVIEAQEYEAPLYFLLARRASQSAAAPRVPIVVHLHSPSELIVTHNDGDVERPDCLALAQLETYTIRTADAWLCPSRFLARDAERRYHLATGSIEVVPYPVGDTAVLRRDSETWTGGSICYIGRLEPRKGVTEWIDAAVAVAVEKIDARFVLIGADLPHWGGTGQSMRQALQARIPTGLATRVAFVDAAPRHRLAAHMQAARIGVVPSRWENFPNTCIEEMASGLPVLASPSGGMVEMVEDGRTGWIADGSDSQSLANALRRALATSPAALERMGADAAASIRDLCDNDRIARRHMAFRRQIVDRATALGRSAASVSVPLMVDGPGQLTGPAMASGMNVGSAGTMTPIDALRAGPRQQAAMIRRAMADPGYLAQWLIWHTRRGIRRLLP